MNQSYLELKIGDVVELNSDNPTFHGLLARVEKPASWGALVVVPVCQRGKSPEWVPYRAGHDEMVLIGHSVLPTAPAQEPVTIRRPADESYGSNLEDIPDKRMDAIAQGLSQEPCPACGSLTLKRNGPCFTCLTCKESTGCS